MRAQNVRLDILNKVIELETSKGHLKWKVSDLARISKVSRPLIYYHFGKTKREILVSSLEIIAAEYYGLNEERFEMLKNGRGWQSVLQTRDMFMKNPSFATFYMKWRMTKTPLQEVFLRVEKKYQESLQKNFPHLSKAKVGALHAILQGVVTAPFLTAEALDEIFKLTQKL